MMRYTFEGRLSEPQRVAWCDWFAAHGIDPCDVAVPGWVELRWNDRQISYEAYGRDDAGKVVLDESGEDVVRTTRRHQVAVHPLPPRLECYDEETPRG